MKMKDKKNECLYCIYMVELENNKLVKCANPDPQMQIEMANINGWFDYPQQFDPNWKKNYCEHFEEKRK